MFPVGTPQLNLDDFTVSVSIEVVNSEVLVN